jgi:putative transposase
MAKPYPMELRKRAVRFVEAGQSRHGVARRLGVSASSVIRWLDRFTRTGSPAPGKIGGHRPQKIQGKDRDWLVERMVGGDFTIQGLTDELETQRGLKVDYRTMWTFVHRQGLSFKKKAFTPPSSKGLTLPSGAPGGASISRASTSSGWCSSMRPG